MSSVDHLKTIWPGGRWPEGLTLEQNLIDLGWHQKARQSELAGGLETRLYTAVKDWIAKEWPFKTVAFPGRDIDWDAWGSTPDD